jgi:hypothetical protein
VLRLIRTFRAYSDIVSLLLAKLGQLCSKFFEVETRYLLIEVLR